jgi:streptogramin lyase
MTRRTAPIALAALSIVPAAFAQDEGPPAVFGPAHLFVASRNTNTVAEFDLAGTKIRDIGPFMNAAGPRAIAFGPDGLLYILFSTSQVLLGVDANATIRNQIDLAPTAAGPSGFAVGPNGNFYVTSAALQQVVEVLPNSSKVRSFGAGLTGPEGIAFAANGHILVASKNSARIIEYTPDGTRVREFSSPVLSGPVGIAISPDGKMYTCSSGNDRILVFDPAGPLVEKYGTMAVTAPSGIQFGPDGKMYVSGATSNSIGVFAADGTRLGEFHPGHGFENPAGVAVSPFTFDLKISGTISGPQVPSQTRKNSARLQVFPGARMATLDFTDAADDPLDFASVFGKRTCVLYGFEGVSEDSPKKRMFIGLQTASPIHVEGDASLALDLRGKPGDFGEFRPSVIKGTWHRSNRTATYGAQILSAKLVKPKAAPTSESNK